MENVPKLVRIDSLDNLEDELEKLGIGKKLGVISGETYTKKLAENICKNFRRYRILHETVGNTNHYTLETLKEKFRRNYIDSLLVIGAGTPIDAAKYVAYKNMQPLVVFPTAPSHDGIASPNITLALEDRPYSIVTISPIAVFCHLPTLCSADYRAVRAGVGDILAKFSASRDLFLALKNHRYDKDVLKFMSEDKLKNLAEEHFIAGAKKVSEEIDKIEREGWESLSSWCESDSYKNFVAVVFEALFHSGVGMGKIGSSIGASGSEHNVAHAITLGHARHGEKVALTSIAMLYLQQNYLKEEKIFGIDWQTFRDKLSSIDIPTTAKELGVSDDHMAQGIPKALEIEKKRGRYGILSYVDENFVNVDNNFAYLVLKETKVV